MRGRVCRVDPHYLRGGGLICTHSFGILLYRNTPLAGI